MPGDAAGTAYDMLPAFICESSLDPKEYLGPYLAKTFQGGLPIFGAVAISPTQPQQPTTIQRTLAAQTVRYGVVFQQGKSGFALYANDGGIVAIGGVCNDAEDLMARDPSVGMVSPLPRFTLP